MIHCGNHIHKLGYDPYNYGYRAHILMLQSPLPNGGSDIWDGMGL
jgi:hypothetical protein